MLDVRAANKRALLEEYRQARRGQSPPACRAGGVLSAQAGRPGLEPSIGRGTIAIPHARLPDLERRRVAYLKLKPPIDSDAIDGQAVDLVFALLLPATCGAGGADSARAGGADVAVAGNAGAIAGCKDAAALYQAIA